MSEKKINEIIKEKDITCGICLFVIDTSKEFCKFIHLENKDKEKSHAYYHVECFRKKISGGAEIQKLKAQADSILNLAMSKMGAIA